MSLPDTMTEITIAQPGGPEVLQPRRVPLPVPAPGEVLVKVAAAGVNRPDVLQRRGLYPMPKGVNPTPGLEVAGTVAALGEGVAGWVVGEPVCGLTDGGGYAEHCVVPATQLLPLPAGMDAVHAAAIPETFFTVWANLFQMGHAQAGETLLVHGGTSGIGATALMLAREFGLRAVSTDGGPEKGEWARRFGAELSIDHRSGDFLPQVMAWSEGRGVDLVLDIMGASHFERNLGALTRDGRLLLIGFMGGVQVEGFNLMPILLKRLVVTGSTLRSRTASEKAAIAQGLRERVWPALSAGRCLPHVCQTFPLEQAAEAHRLMEGRGHVGKIVLTV
ncbi:MAG: NAD(P)H-quinone oxidoreductase [Proteobacteria bacterium]|nr:NAD(P)H-quinone oxidoreductase [Pseudomonadota bacterium]